MFPSVMEGLENKWLWNLDVLKYLISFNVLKVKSYDPLEYERGETPVSVWPHQQKSRFKSLHLQSPEQIR